MMKKLIKKGVLLGAVALTVSACFKFGTSNGSYESNILVHYEPDVEYQNEDFLNKFFNGGADSVFVTEYLSSSPATHISKLNDKELVGGFALCTGVDTIATPERRPARFAVFDEGGCDKTLAYAVFHDTLSTLMPEHQIGFYVPNAESSCTLRSISVQNVHAVVEAVKFGTGLSGGPFTADDFLTLTLTGYKNGASTGNKTVKLVDGTKLLDKWTSVDITSLGSVDYLDLHLESSRSDCPLYCCIDNLLIHYFEKY